MFLIGSRYGNVRFARSYTFGKHSHAEFVSLVTQNLLFVHADGRRRPEVVVGVGELLVGAPVGGISKSYFLSNSSLFFLYNSSLFSPNSRNLASTPGIVEVDDSITLTTHYFVIMTIDHSTL